MHDDLRQALQRIITDGLAAIAKADKTALWTRKVFFRSFDGSPFEERIEVGVSIYPSLQSKDIPWQTWEKELEEAMKKTHPEYLDTVGTQLSAIHLHPRYILQFAIEELWRRYQTVALSQEQIGTVLDELSAFITEPSIPMRFLAPLTNFYAPRDMQPIQLPEGMTLRYLTKEECTSIYGGDSRGNQYRSHPPTIPNFVITGDIENEKIVGRFDLEKQSGVQIKAAIEEKINRMMLAITSFKLGLVEYDGVHLFPLRFCPLPIERHFTVRLSMLPSFPFELSANDLQLFQAHAQHFFKKLDGALEIAAERLFDASHRPKMRDRLADAVFGLEALLLTTAGDEKYRGELRYRFALHYSTFCESPDERYKAFCVARDLYDRRSEIAHGKALTENDDVKIGDQTMKIREGAALACDCLRKIIKHFLPNGESPPFRVPEFWEKRYFGL